MSIPVVKMWRIEHVVLSRLILLILLLFLIISCAKPKRIEVEDEVPVILDPSQLSRGDTIAPFSFIDLKDHDWRVVIRISGADLVDLSHGLHSRMFSTTDDRVLKRIRKWKFIYLKKGLSKATSTIRVFKNGELHETFGIILERDKVEIQSQKLGLIKSVEMNELLEIIKRMN